MSGAVSSEAETRQSGNWQRGFPRMQGYSPSLTSSDSEANSDKENNPSGPTANRVTVPGH